jgi:hypothetical protein
MNDVDVVAGRGDERVEEEFSQASRTCEPTASNRFG